MSPILLLLNICSPTDIFRLTFRSVYLKGGMVQENHQATFDHLRTRYSSFLCMFNVMLNCIGVQDAGVDLEGLDRHILGDAAVAHVHRLVDPYG